MSIAMRPGPWRGGLAVLGLLLIGVFVISGLAMVSWPKQSAQELSALIEPAEVPAGSSRTISVQALFVDPIPPALVASHPQAATPPSPVPVLLYHDPEVGIHAFYHRDPQSSCTFVWMESEGLFIDPCHGSAYTSTGAYVRGPAPRGLDQFGIVVESDGRWRVDVTDFRPGATP